MRTMMTMAAVGLALAWSASAAWSETSNLENQAKSLAGAQNNAKSLTSTLGAAAGVNRLHANPAGNLDADSGSHAKALGNDLGLNHNLKGAAREGDTGNNATLQAQIAGVGDRKFSPDQFTDGDAKSSQLQSFATSGFARLDTSSFTHNASDLKDLGPTNTLHVRR